MSLQKLNRGNLLEEMKRKIGIPPGVKSKEPFRILSKWERRKEKIHAMKTEFQKRTNVKVIPVVHISENSDIYLAPGHASPEFLLFRADREHLKQFDNAKMIRIHYYDGHVEEGVLTDEYSPTNIRVNPSIDESVKPSRDAFLNAFYRLDIDAVRKSIINLNKEQQKILILMFLAGMGISSLIWLGGIIILFLT